MAAYGLAQESANLAQTYLEQATGLKGESEGLITSVSENMESIGNVYEDIQMISGEIDGFVTFIERVIADAIQAENEAASSAADDAEMYRDSAQELLGVVEKKKSDDLDPLIERIETLTGLVKENLEAARIAKGFANEKLEEA